MLYSVIQSPFEKNSGDSLHLFHSIDAAGSKYDLSSFVSLSFFAPKTGSPHSTRKLPSSLKTGTSLMFSESSPDLESPDLEEVNSN